MARVTLRYWAAAKAAAGVAEEVADAGTLDQLLDDAARRHGAELSRVLGRCAFLVQGVRAGRDQQLSDGDVVEVLPPFAGG